MHFLPRLRFPWPYPIILIASGCREIPTQLLSPSIRVRRVHARVEISQAANVAPSVRMHEGGRLTSLALLPWPLLMASGDGTLTDKTGRARGEWNVVVEEEKKVVVDAAGSGIPTT